MESLTVKNINYNNLYTIIKQGGKCKGIVCNDCPLMNRKDGCSMKSDDDCLDRAKTLLLKLNMTII